MADKEFDIKKEYELLSKKYSLPNFDLLNNEFEISSIDKQEFLLRNIRRKMTEKMNIFGKIIEDITHPTEQSVMTMYESSFFNEDEKKNIKILHKNLLSYDKSSLLLDIDSSNEKEVSFIKNLFDNWSKIKLEISDTVKKIKEGWESDDNTKKEVEGERYFG